ncbi:MAG: hypothetical protein WD830_04455, partial [Chloroflexota bacterium]
MPTPSPVVEPTITPVAPSPTTAPTPSPSPSPTPTPSPTSAPRTITSDDGQLTIAVPGGALPAGAQVTAIAQGADDLPPELLGLDVRSAFYSVKPDGLTFA